MLPPAPSQPRCALVKQALWTARGDGSRRQCAPPSLVPSKTPPRPDGTPRYGKPPPATAMPSDEVKKCTVRIGSHGSGSARQCAPPSVVARMVVPPTTQPWLASVKSTVASPALVLVRYCVTQCCPPSAVCRIRSEPTTQPWEEPTNWTAFRAGFAGPPESAACASAGLPGDVPQDGLGAGLTERSGDGLADRLALRFAPLACGRDVPQPAANASASPSSPAAADLARRVNVRRILLGRRHWRTGCPPV